MPAKTMKREEIGAYLKTMGAEFERQLKQLGPALKKKTREDLIAGFADGARSAIMCLERDGYLAVDRSDAPGAATPVGDDGLHTGGAVGASMIADDEPEAPMCVRDRSSGRVFHEGDEIVDFRGDKAKFIRAARRDERGRSGKVVVEVNGVRREFNASVYGLEVQ